MLIPNQIMKSLHLTELTSTAAVGVKKIHQQQFKKKNKLIGNQKKSKKILAELRHPNWFFSKNTILLKKQ